MAQGGRSGFPIQLSWDLTVFMSMRDKWQAKDGGNGEKVEEAKRWPGLPVAVQTRQRGEPPGG